MNAQVERARLLIQQQKYDLALQEIRRVLGDDPSNAEAHLLAAVCLLQQEQLGAATDEASQAIHLAPDWAPAHRMLAAIYFERNRYSEAEASIAEAIRIDPHDDDTFALSAQIQYAQERWQGALDDAEAGLAVDAENALCNNIRALSLDKLGRTEGAVEAARKSLAQHPDDATTHATYGWSLLRAGKHREAQESFREALRLEPNNDFARQGMVQALNSSNPVFRLAFKYYSAMGRLSGQARWAIILGLLFGQRILNNIAERIPQLRPFVVPIILLYFAFVVLTWTADPLFNTFLRFNRYGRYLLTRKETWASNIIGGMLVFGCLAGGLVALTVSPVLGVLFVGYALLMMLPIGGTFSRPDGWPTLLMGAVTCLLGAAGLHILIQLCLNIEPSSAESLFFIYGIVGSQFLALALGQVTVKK